MTNDYPENVQNFIDWYNQKYNPNFEDKDKEFEISISDSQTVKFGDMNDIITAAETFGLKVIFERERYDFNNHKIGSLILLDQNRTSYHVDKIVSKDEPFKGSPISSQNFEAVKKEIADIMDDNDIGSEEEIKIEKLRNAFHESGINITFIDSSTKGEDVVAVSDRFNGKAVYFGPDISLESKGKSK